MPQGGILSPSLWSLHINAFIDRINKALTRKWGADTARAVCILLYADDIMCALAHASRDTLSRLVWDTANISQEELTILGLISEAEKSEGFLLNPDFGGESLFRRHPRHLLAEELTPCARAQPLMQEACSGLGQTGYEGRALPYKLVKSFRLLGITLDDRFSFSNQLERILGLPKNELLYWEKWQVCHGDWRQTRSDSHGTLS